MKTRGIKIQTKIVVAIALVAAACSIAVGIITYSAFSKVIIENSKNDGMSLVSIAAGEVDGEAFASIEGPDSEAFEQVYNTLAKYRDAETIDYIYTMAKDGDNLFFVVDTDEEEPAEYGEEYEWLEDMAPAFDGEVCCDSEVTTDEWGSYYSAYAPIMNGSEVVGIVGVDIPINLIDKNLTKIRNEIIVMVAIVVVISIIIAIIFGFGLGRNLKVFYEKVKVLNSGEGDLTQKLDLASGDELEEIANEFNIFIEEIRTVFSTFAGAVS
ncbi:MAG: hypothetical protein K5656_00690, partial [Lachnospiraceae bacterium]|nr:hypothetical protein [Lachnospiraceae bacterium]